MAEQSGRLIHAGLMWDGCRLRPDVYAWVDPQGMIRGLGTLLSSRVAGQVQQTLSPLDDSTPPVLLPPDLTPLSLKNRVVFPGFVNTHSHAFQRLIRGRTLSIPASDPTADFWSWRTRMYAAANRLSPDELSVVTAYCYGEMLKAGITQVVEFHYIHHDPDGVPYTPSQALSSRILQAASRVGIRALVLPVAYAQGGFGAPALPEQRRFLSSSVEAYLALVDGLAAELGQEPLLSVGMAAHSVRAVPVHWLGRLKEAARARGYCIHVHASEQQAEIQQCLAATGLRPVELLDREGFLDRDTCLVHATWLTEGELDRIAASSASVSMCPSTEQDLGDGLGEAAALLARSVPVHVGSDSHVLLDFFEEMRLLEGHERLKRLKRNVLANAPSGQSERTVVPGLWRAVTEAGGAALGRPAGRLAVGLPWDAFTLDLDDPALDGLEADAIPAVLICAGNTRMVREVFVQGAVRVANGTYPGEAQLRRSYHALSTQLG